MVHVLIKSQIHFTHQVVVCDGNECDFYLERKFRLICAAAYLTLQYSIFHCESNHHRYIFLMVLMSRPHISTPSSSHQPPWTPPLLPNVSLDPPPETCKTLTRCGKRELPPFRLMETGALIRARYLLRGGNCQHQTLFFDFQSTHSDSLLSNLVVPFSEFTPFVFGMYKSTSCWHHNGRCCVLSLFCEKRLL